MNRSASEKLARVYAALAGAMDFATDMALVAAPAFTLAQMGATSPGVEALGYVRFVGVFVAAVGAMYLLALQRRDVARLRTAFEFTLLARAGAGTFTAVAVGTGLLERAWLIVTFTDLACVAAQTVFLAKGLNAHA
jgi:hypothetical protein